MESLWDGPWVCWWLPRRWRRRCRLERFGWRALCGAPLFGGLSPSGVEQRLGHWWAHHVRKDVTNQSARDEHARDAAWLIMGCVQRLWRRLRW